MKDTEKNIAIIDASLKSANDFLKYYENIVKEWKQRIDVLLDMRLRHMKERDK